MKNVFLSLCMLGNFSCFCFSSADIFQNKLFQKILSGMYTIRVSNDVDPHQDWHSFGPMSWVQTVCKGYQQKGKFAANKKDLKKNTNHIETVWKRTSLAEQGPFWSFKDEMGLFVLEQFVVRFSCLSDWVPALKGNTILIVDAWLVRRGM